MFLNQSQAIINYKKKQENAAAIGSAGSPLEHFTRQYNFILDMIRVQYEYKHIHPSAWDLQVTFTNATSY